MVPIDTASHSAASAAVRLVVRHSELSPPPGYRDASAAVRKGVRKGVRNGGAKGTR